MQNNWAAVQCYWPLYDNMAENVIRAKSDLSNLNKIPLERFNEKKKQGVNISTQSCHAKLQGNSSCRFGEKHLWNFAITANVKIGELLTPKNIFRAIQWNPPFYRSSILSRGSTMSKYRKIHHAVLEQINFEKSPQEPMLKTPIC